MTQILKIMVIGAGTKFDSVINCLTNHKVYPVLAKKNILYITGLNMSTIVYII